MSKRAEYCRRQKAERKHYIEQVVELVQHLGPGLHDIEVLHDDWCRIWVDGQCTCHPIVRLWGTH